MNKDKDTSVSIIQKLFNTYDVSLSLHKHKLNDYVYYIAMACWNHNKGFGSVSGIGESIDDAVSKVLEEIQKLEEP